MEQLTLDTSERKPRIRGMAPPAVAEFSDPCEYLQAYYKFRQESEIGFSYAQWARELEFNNRSFLRLLVLGQRRLSDASIIKFTQGLKMKERDSRLFISLVKLKQAGSVQEKMYFGEQLLGKTRRSAKVVSGSIDFLTDLNKSRILTLLGSPGFAPKTAVELGRVLGASVTEIQDSLGTLAKMGLVESIQGSEGAQEWLTTTNSFEVKDQLGNAGIQIHHRKCLEEAIRAIDLPPATRDLRTASVAVSRKAYEEIAAELHSFLLRLVEKHRASESDEPQQLIQVNTSLIPIGNIFGGKP